MRRLAFLIALTASPAASPAAAQTAADSASAANAALSARYLAEVAARPDVRASRSGLLWTVEKGGSGMRPTRSDVVVVAYDIRLPDGTPVDASPPGAPVRLPLRSVVDGLGEALQAMRPGERRTLYLPPALGYGDDGVPGPDGTFVVPPGAVLVVDVTLVRISR